MDLSTIYKVEEVDWRERSTEGKSMGLEDFELEDEEEEPRVESPKKKTSRKKVRKARRPRASGGRIELQLPAGFTVINKKSKHNTWKEYLGPDGITIFIMMKTLH